MPMILSGSCHCGSVAYSVESQAPVPFMRCYCSICRKMGGGGGYAINLSAIARTMQVDDDEPVAVYSAELTAEDGTTYTSSAERSFCTKCGTALWSFDSRWPELIHPFASSIDTELPIPPSHVHIMLDFKASWAQIERGPDDQVFDRYPDQSLEAWHKAKGLWVE